MQAFILGLSMGAVCVAYCAPALLPFLFAEGNKTYKNFIYLGIFMTGRLCGYISFAVIAWIFSKMLLTDNRYRGLVCGAAFVVLSVLLLLYGLGKMQKSCSNPSAKYTSLQSTLVLPLITGLLTGLNLCPPFLLAFTGATITGSLIKSIQYFAAFFLGTCVFFLPAPLVGFFNIKKQLATIGKMSAAVASAYYFYLGSMNIIASISTWNL